MAATALSSLVHDNMQHTVDQSNWTEILANKSQDLQRCKTALDPEIKTQQLKQLANLFAQNIVQTVGSELQRADTPEPLTNEIPSKSFLLGRPSPHRTIAEFLHNQDCYLLRCDPCVVEEF
jgi:hypothetical protein